MRVLHVFDQQDESGPAMGLRLSLDAARGAGDASDQHAWLLFGGEPMLDAAVTAGIDAARVRLLPRPTVMNRWVPGAMGTLKRALAQAEQVECWTPGAAALAGRLRCPRLMMRYQEVGLTPFAKKAIDSAASELAGGFDRSGIESRTRWGLPEDAIVVTLLSDHPASVDVRPALMAVGLTQHTLDAIDGVDARLVMLCRPGVHGWLDSVLLTEAVDHTEVLVQDDGLGSPWQVLPGCDLALATDPSAAGVSLLWAEALGLPIVGPPNLAGHELLDAEKLHTAKSGVPKHLAHELTQRVLAIRQAAPALAP